MVKPSQEDEFLCDMKYFFRDCCYFPYIKILLKVSGTVFEKIRHESTTLKIKSRFHER